MSFRTIEAGISAEIFSAQNRIESIPPYHDFLQSMLNREGTQQITRKSHKLDLPYLSWELVRKNGVLLQPESSRSVTLGTGFEGYYVGKVKSEEELLNEILMVGRRIWDSIRLLHRNSYKTRKDLQNAITGVSYSRLAIEEWMTIYGAELGRQRAQILSNTPAMQFRDQTKRRTANLPKIEYVYSGDKEPIRQIYYLPHDQFSPNLVTCGSLTDEDQLALLTMREIGKFGHPLVRESIRQAY